MQNKLFIFSKKVKKVSFYTKKTNSLEDFWSEMPNSVVTALLTIIASL